MTKKRRLEFSGCLYLVAVLIAVFGAGFSWRQGIVGGVALLTWQFADETFKAAYRKPTFNRYQFRIGIGHLGLALHHAGLYREELGEATAAIYEGLTGKGWIIFTWIEPDLFYINTTHRFTSQLELDLNLPSFGARQPV